MQTLLRLLSPIKKLKLRYFFYISTSVIFGAMWPIQSYFVSQAIKGMEDKDFEYFKKYLIIFFFFLVFIHGTNYVVRTTRKITERMFSQNLYKKYLEKYLTADNNKIESLGTGQSNSIIQKGCDNWKYLVNQIILSSYVRAFVTLSAVCIIIITNLGRKVLLVCLVVFALMSLLSLYGNRRMRGIRASRREVVIQADRAVVKIIMSKFEILQNNKIVKELGNIVQQFNQIMFWDRKESKGFIIASDLSRILIEFMKFGFIARFGYNIFQGTGGFAEFTLIWMMMNQVSGTLYDVTDAMLEYHGQLPFVQKLRNTFDKIARITGYENGKNFVYKTGKIELDNLGFDYGDNHIFEGLSLQIAGGQKTALVGKSGAGKTTLLKLLAGYIHPTQGAVKVDGHDLQKTSLKSYYKNIGYLTQEPNVFDGSVIDNLLYGAKTKPTKAQIQSAIKSSKCEFIYDFKDGLETQIGEKGVRLSGGQKQRLAIAKLFLKNPHIIFLDEPTSSLDSFSEEIITKAFDNLFVGRTVIIAAHRLQTVKQADTILVFGPKGDILESGNHTQLVKKKGTYYKMIELQSGF